MNLSATIRLFEVTSKEQGQRIDNFIIKTMKSVPKSRIYKAIRKGEVRVNKRRVKAEYKLKHGDIVRLPPLRQTLDQTKELIHPDYNVCTILEHSIIYEDNHVLIINKPSGIAVHGGSGVPHGVIEALRARRSGSFLELVHRLDRDTSGCLMIAKDRATLTALHRTLRHEYESHIQKNYLALVKGHLPKLRWVDHSLRKNRQRSGERMVETVNMGEGKTAKTCFSPLEHYPGATLVSITLVTGRTHQIRVHAAAIGHPIAGDKKYGDTQFNRSLAQLGLRRLFLHAASLIIPIPHLEQPLAVCACLDEQLLGIVRQRRLRH